MAKPSTRNGRSTRSGNSRKTRKSSSLAPRELVRKTARTGLLQAMPTATSAAVALGAGAALVLGFELRRQLEDVARRALRQSRRFGKGVAPTGAAFAKTLRHLDFADLLERAGLRARRPFYLRALPAFGVATGVLAAGAAVFYLAPRWKALRASAPRTIPTPVQPPSRDVRSSVKSSMEEESSMEEQTVHAH